MPIRKANKNPMLDTRAYEVEYGDGTIEIMYANEIAECILSQVDDEGHRDLLFEDIIDHRPSAGSIDNGPSGVKDEYKATGGWDLCIQWKNSQTSWVGLKDIT